MKDYEKEVELAKLSDEERELKRLKVIYNKAANDISEKLVLSNGRINLLLAHYDELDDVQKSMLQSQIYQRNFQLSLKKQVEGFLSELQTDQYKSIDDYLKKSYDTGFIGSMYSLHKQGIPLIMPIDQKKVAAAIKLDPKISKNLYTKLGEDVAFLKKRIANNISRGIATASEYKVIARNIAADSNVGFNRAMRIARTEGHGVQVKAAVDVQHEAKSKGADIVKQWDAALDGRTRESHRQVDGEIRELDEKFSNNMMYPSDPAGGAAEVVNCRCALLQRAKWALDDEELETLKDRAKYFKLDKTENFEDFKKKYLKAAEEIKSQDNLTNKIDSAKSLEEVENELKTAIGIDAVNLQGMDIELAKVNAKQWISLSNEYNNHLVEIVCDKSSENVYAQVIRAGTDRHSILQINKRFYYDTKKHTNEYVRAIGFHPSVTEDKISVAVLTHEFGHTLSSSSQAYDAEFWTKIKNIKKRYKAELNKVEKKYFVESKISYEEMLAQKSKIYVSEYAMKNADEFLAESFCMAKLSDAPSPYAMEVLEVVDKYFRKGMNDTNIVKTIEKGTKSAIISSKEKAKKTLDGMIETYSMQEEKSLISGIKKDTKNLELHLDKIAHPEKYVNGWEKKNEYYRIGMVERWKKEVDNFRLQIKLREEELSRRK